MKKRQLPRYDDTMPPPLATSSPMAHNVHTFLLARWQSAYASDRPTDRPTDPTNRFDHQVPSAIAAPPTLKPHIHKRDCSSPPARRSGTSTNTNKTSKIKRNTWTHQARARRQLARPHTTCVVGIGGHPRPRGRFGGERGTARGQAKVGRIRKVVFAPLPPSVSEVPERARAGRTREDGDATLRWCFLSPGAESLSPGSGINAPEAKARANNA